MLIFLDFDGVLHANHAKRRWFSQLPVFESFFRQPEYQDYEWVIASTWRIHWDFSQLVAAFSPDMRHRIIGTTPVLPHSGSLKGSREREIRTWLRDFQREDETWAALDDMRVYFDEPAVRVFFCAGETGLTEQDLPDLAAHLARCRTMGKAGSRSSFRLLESI